MAADVGWPWCGPADSFVPFWHARNRSGQWLESQVIAPTPVTAYPNERDLLVSGYDKNSKAIVGTTNIAAFDHGKGHVTIASGHITFRTWPRAFWTVVTNAMYNEARTELTKKGMNRVFK